MLVSFDKYSNRELQGLVSDSCNDRAILENIVAEIESRSEADPVAWALIHNQTPPGKPTLMETANASFLLPALHNVGPDALPTLWSWGVRKSWEAAP